MHSVTHTHTHTHTHTTHEHAVSRLLQHVKSLVFRAVICQSHDMLTVTVTPRLVVVSFHVLCCRPLRADRIKSATQLDAAFEFIAGGGGDDKAFAEATGIGVVVTPEQVTTRFPHPYVLRSCTRAH